MRKTSVAITARALAIALGVLATSGAVAQETVFVTPSGKVGIGTASPTDKFHVFENLDANSILVIENPSSGLSAGGALRARSDVAIVSLIAHGSGRTLSRFGQVLGGWTELLQPAAGNGLIVGTLANTPLILGTNNTNRLHISPEGNIGIGTASPHPETKLDIRGVNAGTEIWASFGLNPADGPSFNLGYGGATFGRSSGFLNVRPDPSAVAPNPSIRFMTGNIQRVIIDNEGFLGLGSTINPTSPIHHQATGARLTSGGVWLDASSRALKRDVQSLEAEDALSTLQGLVPVRFRYNLDPSQDEFVGFIAEEVPDLVATQDRTTLSPMDIVAVLTKVVQEQQKMIEELSAKMAEMGKMQQ